jgi:hypothetical protein
MFRQGNFGEKILPDTYSICHSRDSFDLNMELELHVRMLMRARELSPRQY